MDANLSKLRVIVKHREAWRATVHVIVKSQTWLSNWKQQLILEAYIEKPEQKLDQWTLVGNYGAKN